MFLFIWIFLSKVQPEGIAKHLLIILPFSAWCCFKKNEVFSKYWHEIVQSHMFSRNQIISFPKFWHDFRNPCEVVCDRPGFFWKIGKWGNGPKLEEYKVFWIYWKICPLICYKFVLTWKFTLFANASVQILYLRKICFLRYGPKL